MTAAQRLHIILDTVPAQISRIEDAVFSAKPRPEKWSRKEILGHLVDSAANNHQRFIRAQLEQPYTLVRYAQDDWVILNAWQQQESARVIHLWEIYNRQLMEVISRIPEETLSNECLSGDERVTLGWLIDDYVVHMEYHLRQIVPAGSIF
jgi:hypothetical protein